LAVALAKRYCRDDKFALEWAEFLHSEVENVRRYASSPINVIPTNDTLNSIVNTCVARTEVLRRACLICGRWGTPGANQAVARAIESLSFSAEPLRGSAYVVYLSLREFGASVCFYWNMAGLIERGDWAAVRALQKVQVKRNRDNADAVIALPFVGYDDVDWKFLKDLEQKKTPISDFLSTKFVAEARDVALGEARAEELFDQTELAIAIGYVDGRLAGAARSIGMPIGRFSWKSGGTRLEAELKRIEELPDSDAFFKAGMLGGSQATAAPTLQKIREIHRTISTYWI
jgi:hypothetical protein